MTGMWYKSVYPYCSIGWGLMVKVEQGKVVNIQGMMDHSVNSGIKCKLILSNQPFFTYVMELSPDIGYMLLSPLLTTNNVNNIQSEQLEYMFSDVKVFTILKKEAILS